MEKEKMTIRFFPDDDVRSVDDIVAPEPVVDPKKSPLELALNAEDEAIKVGQYKAQQEAAKEAAFKDWYSTVAESNKLPESPDDPLTGYDFRRYFDDMTQGGAEPPVPDPARKELKLPAKYSRPGHPDYYQNLPPDVWTMEQTERFIKENPPQTPEQEAQQAHFLEKKNQQLETIKAAMKSPYDRYVYEQNQKALNSGKVYAHEPLLRDPVKMGAFDTFAVQYTKGVEGFFVRPFGREPLPNLPRRTIEEAEKDHPIASATGKALGGIVPVALAIAAAPETLLGELLAFATVGGVSQYGKEKTEGSLMDRQGSQARIVKETVKSAAYAPLWYYTKAISLGGPLVSAGARAAARGTGAAGIEKAGGATTQEAVLTGLMTAGLSGLFELTPLAVDKINSTVKNKSLDDMSDILIRNDEELVNTLKQNYKARHGAEPNEQELKDLVRAGMTIETVKNNISTLDIVSAAEKLRNKFKPVRPEVLGPEAGSAIIPFSEGDIVRFAGGVGRIAKLAGKHALIVSTIGREIAVPLANLQKTGLLSQEIPEKFLKDVPEEKKQYVKDIFKMENPDVVTEFIRNDPHYQRDIELNKQLGSKAFIRSDDESQWPAYYKDYLKNQIEADVPPAQGQPELIVWVGPPGSGKSQISKQMGLDKTHVQIDPDDAKFFIPETKENPALAPHVQAESVYMADQLLFRQALKEGKNIIWPKVGKNPESLKHIADFAREHGYKTKLYFNDLSLIESKKRAYKRYWENKRLVPDQYISDIGDDLTIKKAYDKVKNESFDEYASWDVNIKYGELPRLVEKGDNYGKTERTKESTPAGGPSAGSATPREAGEVEGSRRSEGRGGLKSPSGSPSQKELVSKSVSDKPKSIQEVAEETNILEPNVRRILGVGAKDGTFERVDKGVYILKKDGRDLAYIHAGDSVAILPKLAAKGFKADMIFLDIPYDTPAVKGGNRGVKYALISPEQFQTVVKAIKKIARGTDSPVIYMYSQAKSGEKKMKQYNDIMIAKGFIPVARGEYTKFQRDGLTQVRNMRGNVIEPEGIIVFSQSGKVDFKENPDLNFKLIRPKGYQTEKPAEMLNKLIKMTTDEGDVVLDPFAGSGVTVAEAVREGRVGVGIEKSPEAIEKHIIPKVEAAGAKLPDELKSPLRPEPQPAETTADRPPEGWNYDLGAIPGEPMWMKESGAYITIQDVEGRGQLFPAYDADRNLVGVYEDLTAATKAIDYLEANPAPAAVEGDGWDDPQMPAVIEKTYDELPPEEKAAYELEIDTFRKTPEGNLLKAIQAAGGIKPYEGDYLKEEMAQIPAHLKNKNSTQTLDQLAGRDGELAIYGWVFDSEDELRQEIIRQAKNPVPKVNRAELRKIIREADKNKKYQAELVSALKGKERKFITSVKKSEITSEDLRKAVEGVYDPISNKTTLEEAKRLLDEDFNAAKEMVWKNGPLSRLESTIGMVLIRWYDAQGNTFEAKNLAEHLAARATESGQGVQALAMWSRLSPEGILLAAQSVVRKARDNIKQKSRVDNFDKLAKGIDEAGRKKLAKKLGVPYLDKETADEIVKMAKEIQAMPDWEFPTKPDPQRNALQETIPLTEPGVAGENTPTGKGEQMVGPKVKINRDKLIAQALLLKKIASLAPVSVWDKISMVQTIAQLLNPKTFIRNLLGNIGFQMTENIADVLATALDVATSLRTGKRTVYLPSASTQAEGLKQGLQEGTEEALLGIDLKGDQSKFTLPRNGVFDSGVMGALEKTLRISLGATDRAFYQAAFNQSVRDQMLFAKSKGLDITEPTEEMIERAHLLGLYRTFQDDNAISRWFVKAKRLLNAGGKWGFGDIALKYPKTPANILARGLEYSPFGLLKTAVKVAKPLMGQGEFDQEGFVRSASRAFTGSVLMVAFGAFMAALGIISGKRAKDKDVAATRENAGLREYQINASALKRFVMSGFDPEQAKIREDDVHFTYDWFLPNSIGVALGANMFLEPHQNVADKVLNMGDRMLQASEALQEQPLVQGLKTLTRKENIGEGISEVIKGVPASFVPTLLNQVRQLVDNTARNTKDPNYFKEVYNKTIMRIPGLSSTLPARLTPLGQEKEMYQFGSNNPFNVFLNPAFVTKYKPDPVSKMVLEIWETSGETIQFPRVAQAKIKLTGSPEPIELTPEQYTEYQKYIGNKTDVLFTILSEKKSFMAKSDEEKARRLQRYLTDINTAAKIEVLGYKPKTVPQNVETIMRSIGEQYQSIKAMEEEDDIRSEDDVIRSEDE